MVEPNSGPYYSTINQPFDLANYSVVDCHCSSVVEENLDLAADCIEDSFSIRFKNKF